jgi:hypothetical protein
MHNRKLIEKVMEKKEFSELPRKDVERVFGMFRDDENLSDIEKIKKTREMLKKIFTSFMGRKIMNPKNKDARWFLLRHISTRERFDFYQEVYEKIFCNVGKKEISIIDLGCGINCLSYEFFPKNKKINYVGIEGVNQLVDVVNNYFQLNKIKNAKAINESLFELDEIKKILKKEKSPKICFLFKVLDSLEMVEKDYSKKLLKEISKECDFAVVSFATKSFFKKVPFKVKRNWIKGFIEDNFDILDEFEIGSERYIIFK